MMPPADRQTSVRIKIPFHDLDPAGIVWHGNYFRYFEVARCALLETFDYNYDRMFESGYSWPLIDLNARFVKAVRFNDEIEVNARLVEWEHRLRLSYTATNPETGERICRGRSDQVAVEIATGEMCLRSPDILFEKLGLKA